MADDFGRQLADLLYGSERSESDSAPSDRFRGVSDKLLGTGMRGAATRALLGFDPPEDATGAEMEAYRNFANASMALAAAPVGAVRAVKGAKAVKPSAEQAAKLAESRAYAALKDRAYRELEEEVSQMARPPKGWGSAENVAKRIEDIKMREMPKKRGGKVSFTDNLDTMRLAVQKRK